MEQEYVDCWKVVDGGLIRVRVELGAYLGEVCLHRYLADARVRAKTHRKDRYKLVDGKPVLLWLAGGRKVVVVV